MKQPDDLCRTIVHLELEEEGMTVDLFTKKTYLPLPSFLDMPKGIQQPTPEFVWTPCYNCHPHSAPT